MRLDQLHPAATQAANAQNAGLLGVDLLQMGQHRGGFELRHVFASAQFAALDDADHAERRLLAQAMADQVEVARFEHLELQQSAGKQHRLQRKQGQLGPGWQLQRRAGFIRGWREAHSKTSSSR